MPAECLAQGLAHRKLHSVAINIILTTSGPWKRGGDVGGGHLATQMVQHLTSQGAATGLGTLDQGLGRRTRRGTESGHLSKTGRVRFLKMKGFSSKPGEDWGLLGEEIIQAQENSSQETVPDHVPVPG